MHIVAGWVVRIHRPNVLETMDIYLRGPSPDEIQQLTGGFLETGKLFETHGAAFPIAELSLKKYKSELNITTDVRYVHMAVADDPSEWVEPFISQRSYVVLWFYPQEVFIKMLGTLHDKRGREIPGVGNTIPGGDFYWNGNRPFSEFKLAKHCAYESSRQAVVYPKIAIWSMTVRKPRKKKVPSGAS